MSTVHEELAALSPERRELLERLLARQGLALTVLPIARRQLQQAPLSYTQERLWQIGRMAAATPLGNVPLAFQLHGSLDVQALGRALNYLVNRHEILRTRFESDGSQARQLVDPNASIRLRVTDLRHQPVETRRHHAEQLMHREAACPFALIGETRFRAELWQLGAEDHIFLLLLHHLVVDGVAIRVLLRELSEAYAAISCGSTPMLPVPPIHYGDFAVWQREFLRGDALDRLVSFWERELAGCDRAALANSRSASRPSFHGRSRQFSFSREFSEQLRSVSRREGVTLFMLMAAALHVLERAYTRSDDVQIGTAISYRTRSETEELIGNLGSSVLLRADLSGDPTLREVLERERRLVTAAQGHQELSLELLIDELQRRGSKTRVPPIRTMLLVRDSSVGDHLAMPGLNINRLPVDLGVTWLDLSVDLVEAREIHGTIEHRLDAFDDARIERFIADFQTVLEHLATDLEARLSTLPTFVLASQAGARPEMAEFVAPRTDCERRIAEIWQRVLNTGPVSVRARFFELGGHSLLAMRLVHEIEKGFGQSVSPQMFLEHPTIEGLASALSQRASVAPTTGSLVPIRAQGSRPPFFAVPDGSGEVTGFFALADRLSREQPFYAFRAQGTDGHLLPYGGARNVEQLASTYVKELLDFQHRGPYLLGGTCFGGLVALEMAQLLTAKGHEVAALVIFDTPVHRQQKDSENRSNTSRVASLRSRVQRHSRAIAALRPWQAATYVADRTWSTVEWEAVRFFYASRRLLHAILCAVSIAILGRLPHPLVRSGLLVASRRMMMGYHPAPYYGRILLFRARGTSVLGDPESLGWRDLARAGVVVEEMQGDHMTGFHPRVVRPVAERLSSYLSDALSRPDALLWVGAVLAALLV